MRKELKLDVGCTFTAFDRVHHEEARHGPFTCIRQSGEGCFEALDALGNDRLFKKEHWKIERID